MKLLMISPFYPSRSSGASTRAYYLLKALASNYAVTLVLLANAAAPRDTDADIAGLAPRILRASRRPPVLHKRLRQGLSILNRRSSLVDAQYVPEAQTILEDLFARDRYDVALFESVLTASYTVPEHTSVVIDEHNIEYELLARTYRREHSPLRKWYSWWESRRLQPIELERCQKARVVLVTSEREREVLRGHLPNLQIVVVPNGVDAEEFVLASDEQRLADRVVFTGAMDYYPNIDAVLFFAQRCWPLVRQRAPGATWQIVGRNPPSAVLDLAKIPGVSVTGSVPDVRPYLNTSAIAIAPLLIGAGTRLKILEALATGTAVVSTTLGAEGLDVTSGRHLLLADDPERFARCIIELIENPGLRQSLGQSGRQLAETYDWSRCTEQVASVLRTLV